MNIWLEALIIFLSTFCIVLSIYAIKLGIDTWRAIKKLREEQKP